MIGGASVSVNGVRIKGTNGWALFYRKCHFLLTLGRWHDAKEVLGVNS